MSNLDSEIASELNIPPDPYSKDWNYCGTLIDALIRLDYVISFETKGDQVLIMITDFSSQTTHHEVGIAPTKEKALCLATRRMLREKRKK